MHLPDKKTSVYKKIWGFVPYVKERIILTPSRDIRGVWLQGKIKKG